MLLGHPLDHEFAHHRPFDALRLAYYPEGISTHGQHWRPGFQEIGGL